jgi:hypothetical protein
MIPFNNTCTALCPANHQETIVEQDGKPVYIGKDAEKRPKYTCKPCHGKFHLTLRLTARTPRARPHTEWPGASIYHTYSWASLEGDICESNTRSEDFAIIIVFSEWAHALFCIRWNAKLLLFYVVHFCNI